MDVSKVNSLIGEFTKLRNTEQNKIQDIRKAGSPIDKVDISDDAGKQNVSSMAKQSILDLQTSLVNTLKGSKSGDSGDLYKALTSTADSFAQNNFSKLNPDTKNEFKNLFSEMSKTSEGLVLESLLNETFGSTNQFDQIINQIASNLNKYI